MKILKSNIAAIAILGMLTSINLSAYTQPTWQDDTPNAAPGDIAKGGKIFGAATSAVLTTASVWQKDARFDLNVKNGVFPTGGTYLMCIDSDGDGTIDTQVGSYTTSYTDPNTGDINKMLFQVNTEIPEDINITFMDGKVYNPSQNTTWGNDRSCTDADRPLTIIPYEDMCSVIWTDNGKVQGTDIDIPELTSVDSHLIAEYQEEIMISCTPPVCTLDSTRTKFLDTATASGVNLRLAVNKIDYLADRNETTHNSGCYYEGCIPTVTEEVNATCVTYIAVRNNTEHNISSFDLELPNASVVADAGVAGGHYDLNITAESDANMSVTFTIPAGSVASAGDVSAILHNFDIHPDLNSTERVVARIADVKTTKFTVTYMNPNYKAFAQITAKSDTKLYAKVTDQNGNFVNVEFPQGIDAGKTAFVFVDAAGTHAYDLDALVTAAGGLPGNGWTVEFSTNTAVDVAAYMQTANGERTLTVLYPEYTGVLTSPNGPSANSSQLNSN